MKSASSHRHYGRWLTGVLAALWIATGIWQTVKPLPAGADYDSGVTAVTDTEIEFLHDLTWQDNDGVRKTEQEIFETIFQTVDEAQTVLLADFFLFNDQAGETAAHRRLSRELTDRLIARKRARSQLIILFITDPINDVYGGDPSSLLTELEAAGISVVRTDLVRLRDSNPSYSALWRMFVQWWGNSPAISWLPNPFADGPERISLRSWLALLNFKANHRKLVVADRADGDWTGIVTSANPHDGSSAHSNVAVRFSGTLARSVLESELKIARASGWTQELKIPAGPPSTSTTGMNAAFVTEASIARHLLRAIDASVHGGRIGLGMFYLSDRSVIDALLRAAARGVDVRLILDPNKDAFGRQKDGVPNRPVATELVRRSEGAIQVRWYQTTGEQFHAKLAYIAGSDRMFLTLGSANFTRRNLANYNLEANVHLDLPNDSAFAKEVTAWFEDLWNNTHGLHTVPFDNFRDDSSLRYWRYRVMEATGLSTF